MCGVEGEAGLGRVWMCGVEGRTRGGCGCVGCRGTWEGADVWGGGGGTRGGCGGVRVWGRACVCDFKENDT